MGEESSAQVQEELQQAREKAENAEKQLELAHEQIASLRNENEASKDEATRLEEEKKATEKDFSDFKTTTAESEKSSQIALENLQKELAEIVAQNDVLACDLAAEKKRAAEIEALGSSSTNTLVEEKAALSKSLSENETKLEELK